MPLESATYIDSLNVSNPVSTDSVAQADDHIRLIKAVLKNTFPNVTGPVTATQGALNGPIPAGLICLWSGVTVPSGWSLCDGTSGTPDLRNRFVVGSGTSYPLNTIGGTTTTTAAGSHTHSTATAGGHSHTGTTGGTALTVDQIPAHTHTYDTGTYGLSVGTGLNGSYEYTGATSTPPSGTSGSTGGGLSHTHAISAESDHTHTVSTASAHTHTVTPPYYALAYIMKL